MPGQVGQGIASLFSFLSHAIAALAAGVQAAGSQPQRRRTRHSGVDVMEALDDPDVMLRSDPNLTPKPTPQAAQVAGPDFKY